MAIELCVLASGSAGNCTVVRTPAGVMLIDAGIGPRMAAARLTRTGVSVADVSAICLTHLDRDHFTANWLQTIVRQGVRVFCNARRVAALLRYSAVPDADPQEARDFAALVTGFNDRAFEALPGLAVRPVSFAHDRDGSDGFLIEGFGRRVGWATDLGHVPPRLLEMFCGLDVLAIESNYDPRMQQESRRPGFLKQRITGGRGHLSNQQAFDAVRLAMDRCEQRGLPLPEHVLLLHRSRQCNCPRLLRNLFSRDARIGPRLTLAEQCARTEWIRPRDSNPLAGEQLRIAWG